MSNEDQDSDYEFSQGDDLYEFEVSSHDQHEEWSEMDLEITDMPSINHVDTSQMHIEHTEFDHSYLIDVSNVHLVKEHFPQLAGEQDIAQDDWLSVHLPGLYYGAVFIVVSVVGISLYRRIVKTSPSNNKQTAPKSAHKSRHDAANLSFTATLETLDEVASAIKEAQRDHSQSNAVHTHAELLYLLVSSLFEHVCVDFDQFESILSDHTGSNTKHEHGTNISSRRKTDALEQISEQVNTIIGMLDASLVSTNASKSSKLKRRAVNTDAVSTHVEDRLVQHATHRLISSLKIQFSVIKDALLKVSAISDKKHTKDIFDRLNRAIESNNEYNLVNCMVLLEETDARYTSTSEYRTAERVLSGIHDEEDRAVREREENKFKMHQQDIINTFQALSLNETARGDGSPAHGSNKFPGGGSLKYSPHTNIAEPIVPAADSKACSAPVAADDSSAAEAAPSAPPSAALNNPPESPLGDHVPHRPEQQAQAEQGPDPRQQQQQMTLHHSNSGSLSPHDRGTPHDTGTTLLISSQWAMEALKLRRESEAAVERALGDLRRRRDKLENSARSGARRTSEERAKEVRSAKLFLESIKAQQETRRSAEEAVFQQSEQQLVREFEQQRDLQQTTDIRVFRLVYLLAAVLYLLAYSKFDPSKGGVYALYTWMLGNFRNACQFLSCDASLSTHGAVVQYAGHTSHSGAPTAAAAARFRITVRDLPALTVPGMETVNATALVSSYQSGYRTATQYVSTAVAHRMSGGFTTTVKGMLVNSAYASGLGAFSSAMTGSAGSAGSAGVAGNSGEGTVFGEVMGAGRCAGHVLMRSLPAMVISRLLAFLGLKGMSGYVGTVLSILCFSDILLQMALGPLLPLLLIGIVHAVIYASVRNRSANKLRWLVGGRDWRWFILYVLYSLFILFFAWITGRYSVAVI